MDLISKDSVYDLLNTISHPDSRCNFSTKLSNLPVIDPLDALGICRCKDCIFRSGKIPGQPNILCYQMHDDDFCSYGERITIST